MGGFLTQKNQRAFDSSSALLMFVQLLLFQRVIAEWLISTSDPFPYSAVLFISLCIASWIRDRFSAPILASAAILGVVSYGLADIGLALSLLVLFMPIPSTILRKHVSILLGLVGLAWTVLVWPPLPALTIENLLGRGLTVDVQSLPNSDALVHSWGYAMALAVGPGFGATLIVAAYELSRSRVTIPELDASLFRLAAIAILMLIAIGFGDRLFDGTQWALTLVFSATVARLHGRLNPVADASKSRSGKRRRWIWLILAPSLPLIGGYLWAS